MRLLFPLALLPLIAFLTAMGVVWPQWRQLYLGIGIGASLSLYVSLLDSPPEWIAKWQRGSEGEQRTARALKRLQREGWTVAHDLDDPGWGNHDHVVVGAAGVFVIETKSLSGQIAVDGDQLTVSHDHERLDRFVSTSIARRTKASAASLRAEIGQSGLAGIRWVQAVVVIWGDFPARVAEADRIVYLHGDELARWLATRPAAITPDAQGGVREFLVRRLLSQTPQATSRKRS